MKENCKHHHQQIRAGEGNHYVVICMECGKILEEGEFGE